MSKKVVNPKSFFLFAVPSFMDGVARVVDLWGTLEIYNESLTDIEADKMAVRKDWEAIGEDLNKCLTDYHFEKSK